IAVGSTATRGNTESHLAGSFSKEESHDGISSKLEYRPWRPGDMMHGREMREVKGLSARKLLQQLLFSQSIVGYVESQEVNHFLAHMLQVPAKKRDTIVRISFVYVVFNERRKGIGKVMLRKALEDIRVKWPRVTAAYLMVDPDEEGAVQLYKRLNFTFVTGENATTVVKSLSHSHFMFMPERDRDHYLLYKYPPRDVVETSTAAV
ncbi:hypothetical protein FOZ62_016612, partial [Perkinsus olseni]